MKNMQQTEPFFEVMALNAIVEEIMKEGNITTVYANDAMVLPEVEWDHMLYNH